MKKKMFSVRDQRGEFFASPFYKSTPGEAERDVQVAIANPKAGLLHEFPQDFDLWYVGEFDDQTGKVTGLDAPQHICNCGLLKKGPAPLEQ